MHFVIVVVTYRCRWQDSETLTSLLDADVQGCACDLVIWDNSPKSTLDGEWLSQLCAKLGKVSTEHTPQNLGLAAIYNRVSKNIDPESVLVLLDQDTAVPANYFQQVRTAAQEHDNVELFLPIVRSSGQIVSPGHYLWIKGKHWSEAKCGEMPARGIVAITSGMAVRARYVCAYWPAFDERLVFYGIDTRFMLDFSQRCETLWVMNLDIEHECALWDVKTTTEDLLPRFRNLRSAWFTIHRQSPGRLLLLLFYSVFVSIKLAVKHKDARFLY